MTRQGREQAHQGFDAAAADFTELGRHLWGPIGTEMVATAAPSSGQRVLDACCGTGASAIPAARLVGGDGVVDAVDTSAAMIGELRRFAGGLPQLRAHHADVTGWEATGYDVVQCALGIFFFPDMTAGTRRLIRAARPGGRVVLTIWRGNAMAAAGRALGVAVAEATATEPPGEREPSLFDRINQADTFTDWLTGLGLSGVRVTVQQRALAMAPELAWLVVLGSGYRGALADLAPETAEEVRRRYLARLRDEGIDELDATTLIGTGTAPLGV